MTKTDRRNFMLVPAATAVIATAVGPPAKAVEVASEDMVADHVLVNVSDFERSLTWYCFQSPKTSPNTLHNAASLIFVFGLQTSMAHCKDSRRLACQRFHRRSILPLFDVASGLCRTQMAT